MNESEVTAATERVMEFLQRCGDADIEAGIGAILGLGSEQHIEDFKSRLASAIRTPGQGGVANP